MPADARPFEHPPSRLFRENQGKVVGLALAVSKLVRLSHRYEAGSPERAAKMAVMREKVRTLIEGDAPEANPNGGDRRSQEFQFDISNWSRSGQGGTSREYRISVLKRDAPELAERVVNGELSANAAQERSTRAG